ncbi:hypothetical protein RIF29_02036 [Crotalaria pallida]|uniref:Uncharacterized protein n=1 Tax=Crotalaria pallida TaxID=3830 RepID=A0AAN9P8F0_CROPI
MRHNVQMGSRGIVLDVVRVAPSEADAALSDASICLLSFGNAGRGSFDSVVMQPFSCTPCAGGPLVEARNDTDVQIVRLTWNWRCGMNWKLGYGAQLRANLDPTKGVGRLRQQDGGHGSRNPLRSV